jgi:poly-gamma-glutamate synthesis protein (capsule biosynthesis protein)
MSDYSLIYKDIEKIMQNDSLTFCNVEFPVNPALPQASYPVFNIHPEYVKAAISAGVDVLSLANNHTADQGTSGLIATVQAMTDMKDDFRKTGRDIYFSGSSDKPIPGFKAQTIYKDGWKIGYLAVSQFSNVKPEKGYMQLVDFRDNEQSDNFVEWISGVTDDYDLFILSYHGGVEYYTEPVKRKTELFNRLAAAGVDVIWGHHPHVVQPVDILETSNGKSVIMNSLGNFISGQGRIADPVLPEEEWSYTGDSAIIQTIFSYDGKSPFLEDVIAIPIANIMTTNRDVVIIPIEELTHQAVPEPWMSFFVERFILMHDYFNRNIRYSGLP